MIPVHTEILASVHRPAVPGERSSYPAPVGAFAGFMLQTERLVLREAEAADLERMYAVFSSDPKLLEMRPEIAAAGGYDLASLRTYWETAQLDPVRHVLVIEDAATGAAVGVLDFVTESPADGLPWIGLVVIHGDRQRSGLGSEAVAAVASHLAGEGRQIARMAVMADNGVGLAFARSLSFHEVREAATPVVGRRALVLEFDLAAIDDASDASS